MGCIANTPEPEVAEVRDAVEEACNCYECENCEEAKAE